MVITYSWCVVPNTFTYNKLFIQMSHKNNKAEVTFTLRIIFPRVINLLVARVRSILFSNKLVANCYCSELQHRTKGSDEILSKRIRGLRSKDSQSATIFLSSGLAQRSLASSVKRSCHRL